LEGAPAEPKRVRKARAARSNEAELDSPDPVEIAMKAVAAGAVPGSAARIVLEKHAGLIDIQCRREREELGVLRVQRITRWLILLAAAAALIAVAALIWNASRTVSLVVEPFRVPPALGNSGLGGEVMATRMMDQIALMQSRTLSTRPAESYSTDWGGDIDVAIPSMGATVGDLRRLTRSWFGRETRISGEVLRVGESWTVTARVSGHNAVSATGPQLEPLLTEVAEGVFRQTQPYRHAIYLIGSGRGDEALAAARDLALNGPEPERPWGHVAYANALGGPGIGERERLAALRRAVEALPDFPMPIGNYASALLNLGRWEEALGARRQTDRLIGDGSAVSEEFRGQYLRAKGAEVDRLSGALRNAAEAFETASQVGTPTYAAGYVQDAAALRYWLHDVRAGDSNLQRWLELTGHNRQSNLMALGLENLDEAQRAHLLFRTVLAVQRLQATGDRRALARELPGRAGVIGALIGSFDAAVARDYARGVWPFVAPDLARIGRAQEAEALLAPLEADCYPCLVARGEVAAIGGDRAAARRWFSEAARQGPSLPYAHEALGRMLASAGDFGGAYAAFAEAHRIGPLWAEPLKHWGDTLARQRDWREAERRYRQAAAYAPRWGALQLGWARVLWAAGRRDEARDRLRAAGAMDLSPADRERLRRMAAAAGL
jgi:tetratricopeptide (TPR) repeat protein